MIPVGDEWRIRNALGYMSEQKVLQWARVTICDTISAREVSRVARSISSPRRIGTARDATVGPIAQSAAPSCDGKLARKIEAYITRLAKLNRVSSDYIKRECYGWR